MSQIYYNMAIVETLIRRQTHIRELARRIGTSQTTIARKARELQEGNIVDMRHEGKNLVLFLKDTAEAQQAIYMLEHQRHIENMRKYPVLRRIFDAIRRDTHINVAVLFGSYAKGLAHKESDIDIYLPMTDRKVKERLRAIDSRVSVHIGMPVADNALIAEIKNDHVIIKGVEEYYRILGPASESGKDTAR